MVFDPSPRSEWKMISQGAEARVWKLPMASSDDILNNNEPNDDDGNDDVNSNSNNNKNDEHDHEHGFIVCKERFSKAYRHPDLDAKLTKSRCRSEAKILEKCTTKSKIRVPKVIRISPPDLYLEYLTGPSVKAYLQQERQKDQKQKEEQNGEVVVLVATTIIKSNILDLAQQIGQLVGRLHNIGIVHGDLTTSNMMVLEIIDDSDKKEAVDENENNNNNNNNKDGKGDGSSSSLSSFEVALIDFGLSKSTFSVEEQAVDLYVLERALLSTHPELPENFFDHILEKYSSTTTMSDDNDENNNDGSKKRKNNQQTALSRLEQVRMRGRKRECFG
jgi:TP53 regulating kinase-like protein